MSGLANYSGARILKEWDDGYKMVRLTKPEHLRQLALEGGGCAADHAFWVCVAKPRGEFFFVLLDNSNIAKTILFCKRHDLYGQKHPQDGLPFQTWCRNAGMRPWIYSDYYDKEGAYFRGMMERNARDVAHYQRQYEKDRAEYESVKAEALKMGPLSREHPMKFDVDEANQNMQYTKRDYERAVERTRLQAGMVFRYNRTPVVIIEVAGRGVHYDAAKSKRYTDRVTEWLDDCRRRYGNATT